MINTAASVPNGPDRELLTQYLVNLAPYAESREIYNHEPESGMYWRAFDLVHVALHLSGVRVWSTDSYTGGASLATERSRAARYTGHVDPLTTNTLRCVQPFAQVSFMAGRLLAGLSDRMEPYTKPATHPSSEGSGEFTANSMRLSDMDAASRGVVNDIFQLPPDYDTEFVYADLGANAEDVVSKWHQDNKAMLPPPKPRPQKATGELNRTDIKLTIPPHLFDT
jgi:hypothetical protein